MESSLKNMVLVLALITLCASGAVALVYQATEEPIANAKGEKTSLAIGEVVPQFNNSIAETARTIEIDGGVSTIYTAEQEGQIVGYAVESFTNNGFSGLIKLMVGFLPDGTINGIQVLQHAETPGLGSKMEEPENVMLVSFEGKNPADLKMLVKKDGGDIDALTASTITSRAYVEAVERAYNVFKQEIPGAPAVPPMPSASAPQIHDVDPYRVMFPEYDNSPAPEAIKVQVEGNNMNVFPVRKGNDLLGYVVYGTAQGFKSKLEMLVGFQPDATIVNILVTGQDETPGYGAEITKADNALIQSLQGKKASEVKFGLKENNGDIDGISGSTVTSEAYIKAVETAYKAFQQVK